MTLRSTIAELQRWFESQIRYREDRPSERGYVDGMRAQRQKCIDALKEAEMDETNEEVAAAPAETPVETPLPAGATDATPVASASWPPTDAPILGDRVYVYLQLAGMPGERELIAMCAEVIMPRAEHPMKPGLLIKSPNQEVSGLPASLQIFAHGYSAEPKLGHWSWPPRPLR